MNSSNDFEENFENTMRKSNTHLGSNLYYQNDKNQKTNNNNFSNIEN
jgi:hypothetical protein